MPYDIGPEDAPGLGARRLLLLADYLELQPTQDYNQGTWRYTSDCGTVCCAFGHAVTGLGEVLGVRWESANPHDELICRLDGSFPTVADERSNIALIREVFELRESEALSLFGVRGYYYWAALGCQEDDLTPQIVAKGLRKFATEKLENINAV